MTTRSDKKSDGLLVVGRAVPDPGKTLAKETGPTFCLPNSPLELAKGMVDFYMCFETTDRVTAIRQAISEVMRRGGHVTKVVKVVTSLGSYKRDNRTYFRFDLYNKRIAFPVMVPMTCNEQETP